MPTREQEIVEIIGTVAQDPGAALALPAGREARAIQEAVAETLAHHPDYRQNWTQFQARPEAHRPIMIGVLQVILAEDPALARRLEELLARYREALAAGRQETRTVTASGERNIAAGGDIRDNTVTMGDTIDTGGAAHVGGNVTVTHGDFVGRDQKKKMYHGVQDETVARLFEHALDLARQQPPAVRDDVAAAVETVKEEIESEDADKRLLSKMLDLLLDKAPDILELVVEAILNPAAAAGKGARALAKQARAALQKQRPTS